MTKATFSAAPAEIISRAVWDKGNGLLPAIVQNPDNGQVLMLGYMNAAALDKRNAVLACFGDTA